MEGPDMRENEMSQLIHGLALCAAAALTISAGARADLKEDAPKDVCAYLEKEELKAGEFRELSKGHFFASATKKIGGDESRNTLVYNVDGEQATRVTKVFLNLDIEDPAGAKEGHAALAAAGNVLVEKATGKKVPEPIRKALEKGENGKWKFGELTVEVTKITKGKGPKYVHQLLIR